MNSTLQMICAADALAQFTLSFPHRPTPPAWHAAHDLPNPDPRPGPTGTDTVQALATERALQLPWHDEATFARTLRQSLIIALRSAPVPADAHVDAALSATPAQALASTPHRAAGPGALSRVLTLHSHAHDTHLMALALISTGVTHLHPASLITAALTCQFLQHWSAHTPFPTEHILNTGMPGYTFTVHTLRSAGLLGAATVPFLHGHWEAASDAAFTAALDGNLRIHPTGPVTATSALQHTLALLQEGDDPLTTLAFAAHLGPATATLAGAALAARGATLPGHLIPTLEV